MSQALKPQHSALRLQRQELTERVIRMLPNGFELVGLYSGGELKSEFDRSTDWEPAAEMEPANKHGERIN